MYSSSDDEQEENHPVHGAYSGKKRIKLTPMNRRHDYDYDHTPISYGEHIKMPQGFDYRRVIDKPAFVELPANAGFRSPGKSNESHTNPKVNSF